MIDSPIDTGDATVVQLPVKHRNLEGGPMLNPVPFSKCTHWKGPFEVDVDGGKCKCLSCDAEVSPMFVLESLMRKESQWMQAHDRYHDEMARLAARTRTKCTHCGQITRISSK